MPSKTVLYLSDYQLLVYQQAGKAIRETGRFAATPEGYQEFAAYAPGLQRHSVSLLVDLRQEEYQIARLPHTSGADRRAMLQHRLKRVFANTPYAYALVQGREAARDKDSSRKDDRVLLMGLNSPELLQPWLEVLIQLQIPLQGIYSAPLLSQNLLPKLPAASHALLVAHLPQITEYSAEGLRQSFFLDKQLCVSRLLAPTQMAVPDYIEYVAWEVLKTQQYLSGLGLLPDDRELAVLLLLRPELAQEFRAYLQQRGAPDGINYQVLDITEIGQQFGLRETPQPFYLSHLLAWQALRQASENHYATRQERTDFQMLRLRRWLYMGSIGAWVAALGLAGLSIYKGLEYQQAAHETALGVAQLQADYESVQAQQRKMLGSDADVLSMKNTVQAANYLHSQRKQPKQAMIVLSQGLKEFPQLSLQSLTWEAANAADVLPEANKPAQPSGGAPMGKLAARLAQMRNANQVGSLIEVVKIKGILDPFDGNAFNALQIVKNFTDYLRRDPRIQLVKEITLPLAVNPNQAISGEITSGQNLAQAEFDLEIVFRRPKSAQSEQNGNEESDAEDSASDGSPE